MRTILIGGLLLLLSPLLVPLVLAIGYTVRVVRSVTDGEPEPPVFDDWERLLTDGAKGFAVSLAYFALPALALAAVGIVSVGVFAAGLGLDTPRGGFAAAMLVVLGGLALVGLLWLAASYVAAAGFVRFARTGRLGAAFEFGALRPVLTHRAYATAWLLGLAVALGNGVVTGALETIPFGVGAILGVFVTFYATVVIAYLYARGYANATDVEDTPVETSGAGDEQPAV